MFINFRRSSLVPLYFGLLLVLLPLLTLFTLYNGDDGKDRGEPRLSMESMLNRRIIELKEKLGYIEMINQRYLVEVNLLRKVIDRFSNSSRSDRDRQSFKKNLLNSDILLNSKTDNSNLVPDKWRDLNTGLDSVRPPSLYNFLPHLSKAREPLELSFRRISSRYPNGRMGVSIAIGVPNVKRPIQSYMLATVRNLIENMNFEERNDVVIVVFIAETDMEYVRKTAEDLEREFGEFIDSGLIEIIAPPTNYYPDFNNTLKLTLGDPLERVAWRSKQNLDFAFLMMYCQPKAVYYLQLEDDVITKPNYITKMKNAALKQSGEKKDWFIIEFCSLGFIGKMIRSVDLPFLILFFTMFHNDQPVDWLLYRIGHVRYCRIDSTDKACRQAISHHWIQYRPSLFQHIGTHSSLKGKIQKLREKSFKSTAFNPHTDNPSAVLTTTIRQYQSYSLSAVYGGFSFFWGLSPRAGDHVLINFTHPIVIDKYFIRTSNWEHPDDKFYNTSVQVRPLFKQSSNNGFNATTDGFLIINSFKASGTVEGSLAHLGAIKMMRLFCHSASSKWVLISEIFVKAKV
ncbi:alpha-1,3-mannosyl-glycoprotein 4-beta-N-acetylglucosaminyltransferase a [Brevipalpus obovatus]|uniref:alpha-1,3-mannosyl-glycoprotein 4-beta-N-acetylglucosaminyltransferase a n=1 Tax=Brevipalpus obovatus TaxID=246614 RepID=UPI003D9F6E31